MTSFDVIRQLKKTCNEKRIGHSGTLDPLATGCLLVALWNYTKLIPLLEKDNKEYIADIMLDGNSPSYDSDSEIRYISALQRDTFQSSLTQDILKELIENNFLWEIEQIPPKYSALKINGKRALDRTLAGEKVVMKSRTAHIFEFEILEFIYPLLRARIKVSAGTYIRSIAHDLWNQVWTGGYLSALRRSKIANLDVINAQSLDGFDSTKILAPELLFAGKCITIKEREVIERLWHGQRVRYELWLNNNSKIILFYSQLPHFIAQYKDGVLHPIKKIL